MKETWKRVKGYEDKYIVSTHGRVARLKQKYVQILRPYRKRYEQVVLADRGNKKSVYVHRLVAEAFLGDQDAKVYVNHKDGDKLNNHVSNLEWATPKENVRHATQVLNVSRGSSKGKKELLLSLRNLVIVEETK